MSEEKLKKIEAEAAAQPNPSSIMSAPRVKKSPTQLIAIVAAIVLLALNIIQQAIYFNLSASVSQYQRDVEKRDAQITELKEKINSLEGFK